MLRPIYGRQIAFHVRIYIYIFNELVFNSTSIFTLDKKDKILSND